MAYCGSLGTRTITTMEEHATQGRAHLRGRTKRSHRKSRSGCITCKLRRVKCDEGRPCCENCEHRRIACAYDGESTRATTLQLQPESDQVVLGNHHRRVDSSSASSPGELSPPLVSRGGGGGGGTPALSEVDLAEHYLDHVAERFTDIGMSAEQLRFWRTTVPALAYSFENVRRGMLTLGAICAHYDAKDDTQRSAILLDTAEFHGKTFVRGSLNQTFELDASNVDSLLACSRLLCVLGFAFYGVHRRNGVTLSQGAAWTWLHLLRGVKPTHDAITASGFEVRSVFMADLMSGVPADPALPKFPRSTRDKSKRSNLFHFIQDCHQERFKIIQATVDQRCSRQSDQRFDATLHALEVLERVTAHICFTPEPNLFRSICVWPVQLSQSFFESLIACEPLSLAIYANWLMLVVAMENLWWVNDMGRAVIGEIVDRCTIADADIQLLLHWPQRMAQLR